MIPIDDEMRKMAAAAAEDARALARLETQLDSARHEAARLRGRAEASARRLRFLAQASAAEQAACGPGGWEAC